MNIAGAAETLHGRPKALSSKDRGERVRTVDSSQ